MNKAFAVIALVAGVACRVDAGLELLTADGPWEMAQATNPGVWMPVKVPGTVLQTPVENRIVPEPYCGLNNKYELGLIPDLRDNRDFYTVTYLFRMHSKEERVK